jgi:hypothetical protein
MVLALRPGTPAAVTRFLRRRHLVELTWDRPGGRLVDQFAITLWVHGRGAGRLPPGNIVAGANVAGDGAQCTAALGMKIRLS